MNIDQVSHEELVMPTTWTEFFTQVFGRQKELMGKYEGIEKKNGAIVPLAPWHIDDKFVQWRLKDFAFRFIEELTEAAEVRKYITTEDGNPIEWLKNWDGMPHARHCLEEMADGLHFFAELTIISGVDITTLSHAHEIAFENFPLEEGTCYYSDLLWSNHVARIIFELGLAANLLKNKQWKSTHMSTDAIRFRSYIISTWLIFIELWLTMGCSRDFIFTIYMKKSLVNKWRQDTNY